MLRSGGIFRLKYHLAYIGIKVEVCSQVRDDVKYNFRAILFNWCLLY